MKSSEKMAFVGLHSRVLALDRDSGEIIWQWQAMKSSGPYMTLLPDGDGGSSPLAATSTAGPGDRRGALA